MDVMVTAYVMQDWNLSAVVNSHENMRATTKGMVEMLACI